MAISNLFLTPQNILGIYITFNVIKLRNINTIAIKTVAVNRYLKNGLCADCAEQECHCNLTRPSLPCGSGPARLGLHGLLMDDAHSPFASVYASSLHS